MSAENFISIDFFAVKVDGSDVYQGICLYENLFTDSWVNVTFVNFNSKKVYESLFYFFDAKSTLGKLHVIIKDVKVLIRIVQYNTD